MNPVYCPNCRSAVQPSDVLCPSCGAHQHLTSSQTVVLPIRNPFLCASCGNEAVQKVSALVQGGTWSAQSAGTFGGASYVADSNGGHVVPFAGATQSTTAGASHLARLLTPPPQPVLKSNPWAAGIMLLWGISLFACIFNVITMADASAAVMNVRHDLILGSIGGGLLGLVLLPSAIQTKARNHEEFEKASAAWNKQMQKWDALFYCGRCDNVYHGQTGAFTPAQTLHRLLV